MPRYKEARTTIIALQEPLLHLETQHWSEFFSYRLKMIYFKEVIHTNLGVQILTLCCFPQLYKSQNMLLDGLQFIWSFPLHEELVEKLARKAKSQKDMSVHRQQLRNKTENHQSPSFGKEEISKASQSILLYPRLVLSISSVSPCLVCNYFFLRYDWWENLEENIYFPIIEKYLLNKWKRHLHNYFWVILILLFKV